MSASLKILHLEDLPSDAEMVERELKKGGILFEKRVVDNKPDFEKALKEFSPDIILSDHSLPGFDSAGALKILKSLGIKTPFILITATISEEYAVEIMKAGAYDYILKDRLQRLPQAIGNALEKFHIEDERQKYFEKVIANEILLKEAEKLAHIGSVHADLDAGTAEWSEEMHNILGYKVGEVKPSLETLLNRVHPDDRAEVKEKTQYAIAHLTTLVRDFRLKMEDGSIKYIHSEIIIERDNNKPKYVKGYNQDITELTNANELLKKSEANLMAVIENTDASIYSIDTDLRYITFNNRLKIILKTVYNLDIKEGDQVYNFLEKLEPEEAKEWGKIYSQVLEGKSVQFVKEFNIKDFHNFTSFSINPIWENKKVIGITGYAIDITAQKLAELEREKMTNDIIQRNKDLEQFSYIVSHNLRAPVANIIGLETALETGDFKAEEKKEILQNISSSILKLDDVIKDLNHILQIKREINENKVTVRFSELTNDVKKSIENLIKKENATIHYNFSEVDEILTFKSYLYSIFYNLISNSIKYRQADKPPVIEIKSKAINKGIELTFKDNGLGIDLKKRGDQVFGLYKRFHTEIADGKGMGLYMVKTQVETIGGKISVTSEVNKGTVFKIELSI